MIDEQPTPRPARRLDDLFAAQDERVTVPDWMRQPEVEHDVTRAERLRLGWERHSALLLGGVGAVLVLSLFAVVGIGVYRSIQKLREPAAAYPTISQPAGVQASTSASAPPAAGPFDGTPAASFLEGAAGITLPPAKRTGPFSEKQVTAALTKVRKALVTARLDRRFMTTEDAERLIRQLAPDARVGIRKDFASGVFANYATRLGPGARLTKHQPRVKGRVTYRATRDEEGIRVLEVITNFVWVYAFQSASTDPADGVVLVHDTVLWQVPHPDDVTRRSNGLWLWEADAYAVNVDCVALNKGVLELDRSAPLYGGPVDTEDPDAAYDPDHTLDVADPC